MKQTILYQIKTLDKLILRLFMEDREHIKKISGSTKPTRTQFIILSYLIEHSNEDVYQKDLENVLNLRRATVSCVLHTMEKNALITRVTDSNDTRTKKVIIGKRAEDIFNKNKKRFEEIEKLISKDISKDELNVFFNVISKMKQNIKEENKDLED